MKPTIIDRKDKDCRLLLRRLSAATGATITALLLSAAQQSQAQQVASPQVASPQVASPQVASPQVASPQVASPQVASPQAVPQSEAEQSELALLKAQFEEMRREMAALRAQVEADKKVGTPSVADNILNQGASDKAAVASDETQGKVTLPTSAAASTKGFEPVKQPSGVTPLSSAGLPFQVSGLLQVHGLSTVSNDGPQARADTFRLRRGQIRITVPKVTDRIAGTVMFDTANSQNGDPENAILKDLFLTGLLHKGKSGSHYLDIGQFKMPIGYEFSVSSSALQTIERALMFNSIAADPLGSRLNLRDIGVQLRGGYGKFDYRLGVFNGLGEGLNSRAFSDNKALIARLAYRPVKDMLVGVSAATGNVRNVGFNTSQGPIIGQRLDRNTLNAFLAYKRGKTTVQSEYTKFNFRAVQANVTRDRESYYGSIGYLLTPKLEGVLRYDTLDTNTATPGSGVREATLGFNYFIDGTRAKIQANLVDVRSDVATGSNQHRTELRTNFQVAF